MKKQLAVILALMIVAALSYSAIYDVNAEAGEGFCGLLFSCQDSAECFAEFCLTFIGCDTQPDCDTPPCLACKASCEELCQQNP